MDSTVGAGTGNSVHNERVKVCKSSNNSDCDEPISNFVPMQNIKAKAMGYFESIDNNSFLRVRKDRIIYNEYEDKTNPIKYKEGERTTIKSDMHFYTILEQTVAKPGTKFGNGCNFEYDDKDDSWTRNESKVETDQMLTNDSDSKSSVESVDNNVNNGIYGTWKRRYFNLTKDAKYVIVIGDTGVGKSSLIKLLTNYNKIETNDSTKSCTMNTKFYGLLKENICFIDTRGTEDSDPKTTDKEILNNIQRKMHDYNGSLCKIIWIVHEARKCIKHLREQAQFIKKLGKTAIEQAEQEQGLQETKDNDDQSVNNHDQSSIGKSDMPMEKNSDTDDDVSNPTDVDESLGVEEMNIWDCVLIVISRPEPYEGLLDQIKGLIDLTKQNGCPSNYQWEVGKNVLGFTNLSWITNPDTKKHKEMALENMKTTKIVNGHHGNILHYYHDKKIKSLIYDNLSKFIKQFEILCLKYKCTKCGIIGNPQFVDHLKCHTHSEKYHPATMMDIDGTNDKSVIYYHLGKSTLVHTKSLIKYHEKSIKTKYHSGKLSSRHEMDPVFTREGKLVINAAIAGILAGTVTSVAIATGTTEDDASKVATTAATIATTTMAYLESGLADDTLIGIHTARNLIGEVLSCMVEDYKNCGKYSCCGGDLLSQGCIKYYDCCQKSCTDEGCEKLEKKDEIYLCCEKKANSDDNIGCEEKYRCCGKKSGETGCVEQCDVCKKSKIKENACGFEMKCCNHKGDAKDGNEFKNGCKVKCKQCSTTWGESILPSDDYWDENQRPTRPQGCSSDVKHDSKEYNFKIVKLSIYMTYKTLIQD